MNYLWIDTFGALQLRSPEETVSHFPTQHSKELLVFLLLNPNVKHTRLKLITLLWPDISERKGRGRLNTELWRLRTLLRQVGVSPEGLLQTDREFINFTPDEFVAVDCVQFKLLTDQATAVSDFKIKEPLLYKAADLYKGDFCEDIFSDWCVMERERLGRMYLRVLGQLMCCALECNAYQEAITYGERILQSDPLREEVHRTLMICYVGLGLFPDAARQFHLCAQLLWEELGVLPLPETVALFDRLLVNHYQVQR